MKIYNENQKEAFIEMFKKVDIGKGIEATFKKIVVKRSNDQNSLYWLWLTCIEKETGNDRNDLHDYFRSKFLPITEKKIFDDVKIELTSTTKLTTIDFKNYLDKIQIFANSELSIVLPNPEDIYFEEFKNYYL